MKDDNKDKLQKFTNITMRKSMSSKTPVEIVNDYAYEIRYQRTKNNVSVNRHKFPFVRYDDSPGSKPISYSWHCSTAGGCDTHDVLHCYIYEKLRHYHHEGCGEKIYLSADMAMTDLWKAIGEILKEVPGDAV